VPSEGLLIEERLSFAISDRSSVTSVHFTDRFTSLIYHLAARECLDRSLIARRNPQSLAAIDFNETRAFFCKESEKSFPNWPRE